MHLHDALRVLWDGNPHTLRLWKLSTGDILTYRDVRGLGAWKRGGLCRVAFGNGEVRAFREVSLFEIDGMAVYM